MSKVILWEVPSDTAKQTLCFTAEGWNFRNMKGHAIGYRSTDIMAADFILDMLSVPVTKVRVVKFPYNFSVTLAFWSPTDYAHIFNLNFQNTCTKM
jgi:hypothetical protein